MKNIMFMAYVNFVTRYLWTVIFRLGRINTTKIERDQRAIKVLFLVINIFICVLMKKNYSRGPLKLWHRGSKRGWSGPGNLRNAHPITIWSLRVRTYLTLTKNSVTYPPFRGWEDFVVHRITRVVTKHETTWRSCTRGPHDNPILNVPSQFDRFRFQIYWFWSCKPCFGGYFQIFDDSFVMETTKPIRGWVSFFWRIIAQTVLASLGRGQMLQGFSNRFSEQKTKLCTFFFKKL